MSEKSTFNEVKKAQTDHSLHPLIANRWSPRSFQDRPIAEKTLKTLLEAGAWAASSRNEQPWRVILGRKGKDASFQKILDCLNPRNQEWAQNAPVLLAVIGKEQFSHKDVPNQTFAYDTGAMTTTLAIQALAEDIYIHQMAGFDAQKLVETFAIPDGYHPLACVALGYLGSPEDLPESFVKSETSTRSRKDQSEWVFGEDWDHAYPW